MSVTTSADKPVFKCDTCGHTTAKRSDAKKHSLIHGERPHPCRSTTGCGYRAQTLQNLDMHMSKKHPDEAQKIGPIRRVRKYTTTAAGAIGTAAAAGTGGSGGGGGGGGGTASASASAAAATATATIPPLPLPPPSPRQPGVRPDEKNLTFDEFNQLRVVELKELSPDYQLACTEDRTLSLPKSAWLAMMRGVNALFTPYQIKLAQDQKGQLCLTRAEWAELSHKESVEKNRVELDVRRAEWGRQATDRKAAEAIRNAKIEAVQKELTKTMSNYETKAELEKEVKVDGPTRVHAIAEKFFAALFRNDSKAFDEKEVAAVTEIATRTIRRNLKDSERPMYTIADADLELEAEFGALGSDPATGKLLPSMAAAAAAALSPVSSSSSGDDDDDD